jgi:putative ABC transport system permease protein
VRDWLRRLSSLLRSRRWRAELDEELTFHVQARTDDLVTAGVPRDAARRQAEHELGAPARIVERAREAWAVRWLDDLLIDARTALRRMRTQPWFTAAVLATFAVGIGSSVAVVSLAHALLVRPAPFRNADRLALVYASRPDLNQPRLPLSYPNFADLRSRAATFSHLAAWTIGEAVLTGDGGLRPVPVQTALATSNLFDALGVVPALGRAFRPDEDRPGTARVIVVTHGLWQRHFAGDPAALGRSLHLDGVPHEIVGILPESFRFAEFPRPTDVWLPFGLDAFPGRAFARGVNALGVVGRLSDGRSWTDAATETAAIGRALEAEHPAFNRHKRIGVVPLTEQARASIRPALYVLSAAVLLVLLLACANVLNLLLARATAQQSDLALRATLGASRSRLVRQLVTEHVLLALCGGTAGLAVAWGARRSLRSFPYQTFDVFTPWTAQIENFALDGPVLTMAIATSLSAGLLGGVWPAFRATHGGRPGWSTGSPRITDAGAPLRTRTTLVIGEVALAVVLLSGTGLMISGLATLLDVDPGFDAADVVLADVTLPATRYRDPDRVAAFVADVVAGLEARGLMAAAAENPPFATPAAETGLLKAGEPIPPPDRRPRIRYRSVSARYFDVLGIPMASGRPLARTDDAEGRRVALINTAAATLLFGGAQALGQRVAIDLEALRFLPDAPPVDDLEAGLREIVGVTGDVKTASLDQAPLPEIYIPIAQRPVRRMTIVVKSGGEPAAVAGMISAAVREVDPLQPVAEVTGLRDLVAASVAMPRFNTILMTAFGTIALGLAAVGVFGALAFFVSQRTREIGIRVALGATPADVLQLIIWRAGRVVSAGLLLGIAAACCAGPLFSSLLLNVPAFDGRVLAGVSATVLLTAAVAAAGPTLRALGVDPARMIRED